MIIIISLHSIFFSSFHLNNGRNMKLWQFFCFLKILFFWNFFSLLLCSASFYYKATKSNYSVCEHCLRFFCCFPVKTSIRSYEFTCFNWLYYYSIDVAFCDKYLVRCLFISIGFLTYLPIRSHIDSYVYSTSWRHKWTNCQVNCIKRIDNEFTGIICYCVYSMFAPYCV